MILLLETEPIYMKILTLATCQSARETVSRADWQVAVICLDVRDIIHDTQLY